MTETERLSLRAIFTINIKWQRAFTDESILTKCCMSLQVKFGLACKARAQIPAAMGALAEVPV